ncbi:glycosyltransferase [Pedobacter sp. MC2016-14]|uniref:glycosyltransferase n=1 Tax=Pedobacter sp. MC2016-14 TaxID=2897327 RepID=UPI001E4BE810|nr:glycosyltransferase [Pedobacter sp. MC2016-14]MCD0486896.1 glycosyltransferase [Pedobacter sp. MC2016-14]
MMKEKYVIITPFFPTDDDFVGPYIYDQVKAIQKTAQYELIVIKIVGNRAAIPYIYQGIFVNEISLVDLPSFILPGLFLQKNIKNLLSLMKMLTDNNLSTIKFIHGHVTYPSGLLAVLLAQKIGAKSIVQHHGFDVMGYTNGCFQQKWLQKLNALWINKFHVPVLNKATWNVGVSKQTLSHLNQIPGYQPKKELVLYNGTDPLKFYPIAGLKDQNYFTIGCVGNFWAIKDQLSLLKALRILRSKSQKYDCIRLKLIGSGQMLNTCIAYVNENGLSSVVHFLPTLDHTQLNAFYNSLDLFVLPSYDEAFGCVYTEAYACGVPFIAVEGQGIAELVTFANSRHQLMKKEDIKGLADQIEYFFNHRDFRPELMHNIDIDFQIRNFMTSITVT